MLVMPLKSYCVKVRVVNLIDSGVGRVNDQFLDLFGLYQSIPSSIACMLCEDVKDSSAYIKLMVLDLWIFNACDAPQILLCQG